MFNIDNKDIIKLEKDLKQFASRSLPFATKQTINQSAFQAQKIARADVQKNMINRNKFTIQSIRVNQTRSLNIRQQQASTGSIADYMETQEFGGTKHKKGKEGTPIATSYSAGQAENARPRTRLPKRANKLQNIQLKRQRVKAKNRKQRNSALVKQASTSSNKYVFLDLKRTKGIFKVIGKKKNIRVKMIHDLSNESVSIPRNPWLKPAVDESTRMLPAFYADALRFQLRRRGLFK